MSEKLKVGIVGIGGISGVHVPAWLEMEDVKVLGICDIRPEQMDKYPGVPHFTDYEKMLSSADFDIIDICLPTPLHVDYAVKAMNRGINVITEKPISLREEDVDRAYTAAEKNGVLFMVAQCVRFMQPYALVKEYYDSKKYGKLLSGSMWRLGNAPRWSWDDWMLDEKRSGFIPYDLHIHDLDYMVYAFGKPEKCTVNRAKAPDQDYLSAVYEYDGFFIHAESSWYKEAYPFQSGFRFQFEDALVVSDRGVFEVYEKDGIRKPLEDNVQTGSMLLSDNSYANELRYFADAVKAGTPIEKVRPEELSAVIRILNSFPGTLER